MWYRKGYLPAEPFAIRRRRRSGPSVLAPFAVAYGFIEEVVDDHGDGGEVGVELVEAGVLVGELVVEFVADFFEVGVDFFLVHGVGFSRGIRKKPPGGGY